MNQAVRAQRRQAVATIGALVALSVVSMVLVAISWHFLADRRLANQRHRQHQAEWLSRAGVELAIDRLLTDSDKYKGETVELLPRSRVLIKVEKGPGAPGAFRIVSEARYPAEGPGNTVRSITRVVRRKTEGDKVSIEAVGR